MQKTQLKLFEPFLDKELDYKNDLVLYISTDSNDSNIVHNNLVTPKSNNITSSLNKKYEPPQPHNN